MKACAPSPFQFGSRNLLRLALAHQRLTIPASEFFDAAGGVDELLLAGKKRMAGRANADFDIATSRPSVVDGATCTDDSRLEVFRMDVSLHVYKKETKLSHSSGGASGTEAIRQFLEASSKRQRA